MASASGFLADQEQGEQEEVAGDPEEVDERDQVAADPASHPNRPSRVWTRSSRSSRSILSRSFSAVTCSSASASSETRVADSRAFRSNSSGSGEIREKLPIGYFTPLEPI